MRSGRRGRSRATPLTDEEVKALRTPVPDLIAAGADREEFRLLNNRVVRLARSAMQRAKAAGAPTVEARTNLRIPSDWFEHYTAIYESNLDWALSPVLQNAMIENPLEWAPEARPARASRPIPPPAAVSCWRCKASLDVTDQTRGKRVRCPSCGTRQATPI